MFLVERVEGVSLRPCGSLPAFEEEHRSHGWQRPLFDLEVSPSRKVEENFDLWESRFARAPVERKHRYVHLKEQRSVCNECP